MFQLLSSLVKLSPKRKKQPRHAGIPFPASSLVTFAIIPHWLALAGMCASPNAQPCLHEEVKHPEVTQLKWQVRTIFQKGACQINRGKTNPLEKGDRDYLIELQQKKIKDRHRGEGKRCEVSIPIAFPAGLTLTHCLAIASLPCKGCVATAESNALLEKEHLLSAW